MAASFKSNAVDGSIDFGYADNLGDLIGQRGVFLEIDRHAAEALRLRQPFRDHVADHDDCCPKQVAGSRAGKAHRAGPGHINDASGGYAGGISAVITRREDVRQ